MRPVDRLADAMRDAGVPEHRLKPTMARLAGVRVQSVHGWFKSDTKEPRGSNLAPIAKAYGLSLHWVYTGEGERKSLNPADEQEVLILELLRKVRPELRSLAIRQLQALADESA